MYAMMCRQPSRMQSRHARTGVRTTERVAGVILWWLANAVALLVVIPLVILLANRVIAEAREIRQYSDEILEHGVRLTGTLDPLPALADTRSAVEQVTTNAVRYVTALRRIV
jgi:hypothetical protein